MTGLDKILEDIRKESDTGISAVLEQAQREAEQIRSDTAAESAEKCEAIARHAQEEARAMKQRAESAAMLEEHKAVLRAKQQIIRETVEKARQSLCSLPDAEYFALMLKMAQKYALPQNGELLFSPADLKRMPADFARRLSEAVGKKAGAALTVSARTREIDGGFILSYGDVEENCSFSALFDAKHDRFTDLANTVVFAEG